MGGRSAPGAGAGVAADGSSGSGRGRGVAALGVFLLVGAVYCLTASGRIDTGDGQFRYEVTRGWLTVGEPVILDPALSALDGLGGKRYSAYGASPSLAALPLVWLGGQAEDPLGERRRFFFSLTTPLFGGLVAALGFLFLGALGVAARPALGWTLIGAFASLVWPLAASVFDQVQQAFFVLLAAWCGLRAARRRSVALAAAGSLALAALINYQPNFLLLVPGLALTTLARPADGGGRDRRSWTVAAVFLLGAPLGLGLSFHYNEIRFGTPFFYDRLEIGAGSPPLFGSPYRGLAGLVASPGKSVLLYSPTVVIGLAGFAGLRRREPAVAWAVAAVSALHLLFVSWLSFFHGDWAWGPRYLAVILPLWVLAMPFARLPRPPVAALVAAGVAVQLLGLAVVHDRFFYQRGLSAHFWWPQDGFYFRQSALLARPGELLQTITEGPPPEAERFAPTHRPGYHNSFIVGPVPAHRAPGWMRHFRVFYRLRPWPLWALAEPPGTLPVSLPLAVGLLVALGLAGAASAARGLAAAARAEAQAIPGSAPSRSTA